MATKNLGRYEILSELGQGAMGVVYKAIDPLIERTVAIKTIKLDLSTEEIANFEERFYREAKSAGRLNHPNIVTIYDVGKTDHVAYMAMEFMEGRLLRDVLDAHTALSTDHIVDIAAQIADGLAYAHEHGIVHRDIKPANIMLVRGDVAKIMDFGIAQMPSGARTLAGAVMGSPKYMAPEQVVGNTVDGRSDLFALGVILYEMLTGESPFDGDNINTIMYRIVHDAPVPPKSLAPRIPEIFNSIIAKTLAKQPDQRYQNAKALANDLRNYKSILLPPTAAIPVNPPTPRIRQPVVGEATISLNPGAGGTFKLISPAGQPSSLKASLADSSPASFLRSRKIPLLALIAMTLVLLLVITIPGKKPAPKPSLQLPANTALSQPDISPSAPKPAAPSRLLPTPTAIATAQNTAAPTPAKIIRPNAMGSKVPHIKEKGKAILNFSVFPWGEIYIDGKKAGVTPPVKKLTIPAGKHKIEIKNLNFTHYSETMELKAGSSKHISYTFQ
ncbi:MAG: protein kinase domain-containing protein [Sulfuriferula sp.]